MALSGLYLGFLLYFAREQIIVRPRQMHLLSGLPGAGDRPLVQRPYLMTTVVSSDDRCSDFDRQHC